jgi:anaerobic magnesium-protoporphyrin IX monomethyl ester cyclase
LVKVTLVFPYFKRFTCTTPPFGIMYLAAVLEKHDIKVNILDTSFNQNWNVLKRNLEEIRPDFVGISSVTPMIADALKVAELAKKLNADCTTILGGPHATVVEVVDPYIDFCVYGEGEATLAELISTVALGNDPSKVKGIYYKDRDKIVRTLPRPPIENLSELPFPAWHLLPTREQYFKVNGRTGMLIASRGCPFNCTYCQPTLRRLFGNKIRFRTPENVVDEMEMLIKHYHVKEFFFHDDTFTFNKTWVKEVCGLILKRGIRLPWKCNSRVNTVTRELLKTMKQAGCTGLALGVESGSQEILDRALRKGIKLDQVRNTFKICKEEGIDTKAFLMLGSPFETSETLRSTVQLVREIKPDLIDISRTTPLPGSDLFTISKELGILNIDENSWTKCYYRDLSTLPLKIEVSNEEILATQKKIFVMNTINVILSIRFAQKILKSSKHPLITISRTLYFMKEFLARIKK